jgi:hypothetical protein
VPYLITSPVLNKSCIHYLCIDCVFIFDSFITSKTFTIYQFKKKLKRDVKIVRESISFSKIIMPTGIMFVDIVYLNARQ